MLSNGSTSGVIHVTQIKAQITKIFENKIDLSDIRGDGETQANIFLSRALAAYAVYRFASAEIIDAAASVT
jgi:hypothetical protein